MTATDLRARLHAPADAAGLAVFRALFGGVMLFAVIRFAARGWIDELLLRPTFHFTYLGLSWVRPWPAWGMYLEFVVMGTAAAAIAAGAWTRASAFIFCATFTHAELIDKTLYLNHYYFVSLVAGLLVLLPSNACWSVDAWRRRRARKEPRAVPAWSYAALRVQVALVYLFAGFAKLNGDWLLAAEPLRTWLRSYTDVPLVGPALGSPALAYALSWGGALFDLTVVFWLCWPRTRPQAFLSLAAFHLVVWCLFPIGVFSWVMIGAATIFLAPDWPRGLLRRGPLGRRRHRSRRGSRPRFW
jgi:vitamin K-dependent gamma-carboxylase